MFEFFRKLSQASKIWSVLLKEKYLQKYNKELDNIFAKIEENKILGNHLIVQTDDENVKNIFAEQRSRYIKGTKSKA